MCSILIVNFWKRHYDEKCSWPFIWKYVNNGKLITHLLNQDIKTGPVNLSTELEGIRFWCMCFIVLMFLLNNCITFCLFLTLSFFNIYLRKKTFPFGWRDGNCFFCLLSLSFLKTDSSLLEESFFFFFYYWCCYPIITLKLLIERKVLIYLFFDENFRPPLSLLRSHLWIWHFSAEFKQETVIVIIDSGFYLNTFGGMFKNSIPLFSLKKNMVLFIFIFSKIITFHK